MKAVIEQAKRLGLRMMVDLAINHCAVDAPLVKEHPKWFARSGDGIGHPFCMEENGNKVVWRDLARFDHRHSPDAEGLLRYCGNIVEHLVVGLGFTGLRCDAAYQIPSDSWRRLPCWMSPRSGRWTTCPPPSSSG